MTETSTANLIPPTPRPATRRASWRAWAERPVQLWWKCALAVAVVMAYVTIIQVRQYLREKDLLANGLPVTARIIELDTRKIGTGNYRPLRENEMFVKLAGTLPDGRDFHYEGMLPRSDGYAELGGDLRIRVDPRDTTRWIEVPEHVPSIWNQFVAVVLLSPLIVILLGVAQWQRMRVLRVWRNGKVREAAVVGCKHSAMSPRSCVCRYTLLSGDDRRVFEMLYPARQGVLQTGDVLDIIVMPDRPELAIAAELYVRETGDARQG